jgi:cytochrome c-type biogenesis protein CcmH/NrfG
VAPQNVLALQLMAEAELQANDCRSALGYYQRAQQLRPDLWKTSFFLGVADLRCGLTAPAAEALSRAAAMDTATRDQAALAWYELARARLIQRDESGAETALTQAALRDPASHKIQALLAQVHAKTTAVQGHSGRP